MPQNETLLFVLFGVFVLAMLALDLGVFHRKAHAVGMKEAAAWSTAWIALSLLFNLGLFFWVKSNTGNVEEATKVALEFLTAYLIEKALSVDNIFVFILIFSYFGVPSQYHHKVLFWGVIGALIMRFVFIATGTALIHRFGWILYIFGAILLISGWKMMMHKEVQVHPEKNFFIRIARRLFPVESGYGSQKFIVKKNGKIFITPLLLVLITVETTDVVFAVDSIPAVFGVTHDPFIVYSSNVFAILGLRALYFLLANVMSKFFYLSYGLSIVLMFIGAKMVVADFLHIPIQASLIIVASILTVSVGASLYRNRMATAKK
jgi:tellurite resistance protein TerC